MGNQIVRQFFTNINNNRITDYDKKTVYETGIKKQGKKKVKNISKRGTENSCPIRDISGKWHRNKTIKKFGKDKGAKYQKKRYLFFSLLKHNLKINIERNTIK